MISTDGNKVPAVHVRPHGKRSVPWPAHLIIGACPSNEYQLVSRIIATLTFRVVVTCARWRPRKVAVVNSTSLSSPIEGEIAKTTVLVLYGLQYASAVHARTANSSRASPETGARFLAR